MSNDPPLEELVRRLLAFRDARDWHKFHSAKNLAMSVSIEAGELLEVFQWTNEGQSLSPDDLANARDEAADVLIYLLLLCDKLGIDLAASTANKIERNETRFPPLRGSSEPMDTRE